MSRGANASADAPMRRPALTTVHDAFMAMYYALEAATDDYPDQGLQTLVQDCDPFVWKDRLSADPAVKYPAAQ